MIPSLKILTFIRLWLILFGIIVLDRKEIGMDVSLERLIV